MAADCRGSRKNPIELRFKNTEGKCGVCSKWWKVNTAGLLRFHPGPK